MQRPELNYAEPKSEFVDAIHRDWQKIVRENPPLPFDRLNTPFSPGEALKFAEGLADVKSEEEGLEYTMHNPTGLAIFLVAAHFAFPYLPVANDQASKNQLRFGPPYVALAKGVVNFLKTLTPQLQREH